MKEKSTELNVKSKDKLQNKRRYSEYVYFLKGPVPRLCKELLQLSNKIIQ